MRSLTPARALAFGLAVAVATCAVTLAGCRSGEREGQDTVPKRDITAVMEAHVDELMAVPDVAGVAIGALDDGTPCIKVYLVKSTPENQGKIPSKLEGHPVVVEVTGEIKPM